MRYVDVILPLPLQGLFTYAIADEMAQRVSPGTRLLVPLGRSKTYTAIAVRLHDTAPDMQTKEVMAVLDDHPVLLPQQLKLWQWISDYYMSPIGDVYKAALPAGMKAEDGYKPHTEVYVGLPENLREERTLHIALDMLRRSSRQLEVFNCFLRLSHWDTLKGRQTQKPIREITREELLNASHSTSIHVRNLLNRRFLYTYEKEVGRLNITTDADPSNIKPLSEAQEDAYNQILMQWMKHNVVLLHGVTSSGKTEIYIHLIAKALQEKRQVLYLLPEIALTVQIMERLRKVFGDRLGIYHSRYSDDDRMDIWRRQLSSHPYDVILGARSAVFLPFQNLGLVIVDEEHETSFKQQEPSPRYHARSAAIMLARMYGAKVLLGTATPSMESYYNAQTGKYGLVRLSTRFKDIQLPLIETVDIKDLQRRKMMTGPFSPTLLASMREALKAHKQVILFQNRRGFAPMITCKACGWVPKCQNCDVSLTYHKRLNMLTCHYCGYTYRLPERCPNCDSTELVDLGYGTEKVEDYLRELLPDARVARMDLDTTRTRNAYERLIDDFSCGKTNVLIGTQMISKGLDFDNVSVVGILNADTMLNYPDFRAYEHAFMMMSQVSGRAGRKGERGHVILQTKSPDLPVIQQVVSHDYDTFYHDLLLERRQFHYPPFYHLIYIYLRHRKDLVAEHAGVVMGSILRQWFGTRVLGPDKPAVARVKSMSIRKIVLKIEPSLNQSEVKRYLHMAEGQLMADKEYASLQVYFDVDPL